jgi:hypothetical protein
MQWFQDNWVSILNVVCYVIAGASIVVKLTPTKEDDKFLWKFVNYFVSVMNILALNPKVRAKMKDVKLPEVPKDEQAPAKN